MPAKLAPDQSRGYLIPIGTTVRGAGETGIFKRLIAMLRQRCRVVLITATTTDDSSTSEPDCASFSGGASNRRRRSASPPRNTN